MFNALLIVPARSGSKGVVDKNIRPLGGQPLLAWTAQAIQQAGFPESTAIVSTDSAEYASVGQRYGLQAPFLRPADISGDTATAMEVIEHAIDWYRQEFSTLPELTFWLQPTSPFRGVACLRQAWQTLQARQADAVVACTAIHRDLTTLFRRQQGYLRALDEVQPTQTARQQIDPLLTPNGALYAYKTEVLLAQRSFYPDKTVPLLMNAIQSLDIDTELDWSIAEAYIKQGLL